jgi:hypothetical protein
MDSPFLLGDSGYPLLPWLLVPRRLHRRLSVLESVFNRRLRIGRCVVENAFGILKQTWRELLLKSDQTVNFMPDLIAACCILHKHSAWPTTRRCGQAVEGLPGGGIRRRLG